MVRTVYIAAVLGVMTFFVALSLGISWGLVLSREGPLALMSSFVSVGVGLGVGLIGFALGLLLFRIKKNRNASNIIGEVEGIVREDARERVSTSAN